MATETDVIHMCFCRIKFLFCSILFCFKLQTSQFMRDVAKNQFCNRVVDLCNWNNRPDYVVATDTIVHFKNALRTVAYISKRH